MTDIAPVVYALLGFIILSSVIALEARDLLSTVIPVSAAGARLVRVTWSRWFGSLSFCNLHSGQIQYRKEEHHQGGNQLAKHTTFDHLH